MPRERLASLATLSHLTLLLVLVNTNVLEELRNESCDVILLCVDYYLTIVTLFIYAGSIE